METIPIIYIMGYGRSGSTVLDAVLGNHPRIFSTGELVNLPGAGWIQNQFCSCHQRVRECRLWSAVFDEWIANNGGISVQAYHDIQHRLFRFRHWPRLLAQLRQKSSMFLAYETATLALFRAIRRVSGRSIIVDSSKYATRALALSHMRGIDLKLIHLVRDIRGVAWSLRKTYLKNEGAGLQCDFHSMPAWKTSLLWMLSNLEAHHVRQRLGAVNSRLIHYEDFVSEPETVLSSIGMMVETDFFDQARMIRSGASFSPEHLVAGNRLRMNKSLKLTLDSEWKAKLPDKDRLVCMLLGGWLQFLLQHERSRKGLKIIEEVSGFTG